VNSGGTFDLNNHTDSISLTVVGGSVTIGTGTLFTGSVTMTGGSIASTGAGKLVADDVTTNAASAPATISGNLDLGGSTSLVNVTVADGAADPDLDIAAVISNGGFVKKGTGTLRLSGSSANTYTGLTSVFDGGLLELAKTGGAVAVPGDLDITFST